MVWMNSSNNKFFIKLLYDALEPGGTFNLPKCGLGLLGAF